VNPQSFFQQSSFAAPGHPKMFQRNIRSSNERNEPGGNALNRGFLLVGANFVDHLSNHALVDLGADVCAVSYDDSHGLQ
jgi:hypothetical protein